MEERFDPWRVLQSALLLVYRQRRLILGVFLACVGLAAVVTMLTKPVYHTGAKLLVTVNRAQLAVTTGSLRTNPPNEPSESDLNSIVSILRGRELVEETLQKLEGAGTAGKTSLTGILRRVVNAPFDLVGLVYRSLHGVSPPTALDQRVAEMYDRIEVTPVRRSNVIEISFEHSEPVWASRFLNTLTTTYLDYHARTFEPAVAETFFQQQSRLLEQKLNDSEEALKRFRDRVGIISIEAQKTSVLAALAAAEAARDNAAVEAAAAGRRIAFLDVELERQKPRIMTTRREVQNLAVENLKAQLLTLQVKRAELATRYTASSEKMREVDQQIRAAQAIVASESAAPFAENETGINPTYQQLYLDRAQEQSRVGALASRRQALEEQIAELRRRLVELDGSGLELERLERQVKVDEEAYLSYARKKEAARLSNALNRSQILNVSIAEPAPVPITPVRPQPLVNLLLGALIGLSAGVAAAFLREQLDDTIKTAGDVRKGGDLEVLAVIPEG